MARNYKGLTTKRIGNIITEERRLTAVAHAERDAAVKIAKDAEAEIVGSRQYIRELTREIAELKVAK